MMITYEKQKIDQFKMITEDWKNIKKDIANLFKVPLLESPYMIDYFEIFAEDENVKLGFDFYNMESAKLIMILNMFKKLEYEEKLILAMKMMNVKYKDKLIK